MSNVDKALKLPKRDLGALKSIYDFRGLTAEQIFEINYKQSTAWDKEVSISYFKYVKLKAFKDLGLIDELYSYNKDIPAVYFLTVNGVTTVRRAFGFVSNVYEGKKLVEANYQTARQLKVEPKFIPHQYNLNCFAIEAIRKIKGHGIECEYEDERHTSKYEKIRPDGVIYTDTCDYFLEMDMGTETEFQLNEKWKHYRSFKNSNEYFESKKPMKILFICGGVKNIEKRIAMIKKTISMNFIDLVEPVFDIYVDSHERLMDVIEYDCKKSDNLREIIDVMRNRFGIAIGKSEKYNTELETTHPFYGKTENGVFAIDDSYGNPLSLYRAISKFKLRSNLFEVSQGVKIRYIVKVASIYRAMQDFERFSVIINGDVLFTTEKLLENAENLNEALVTFIGSQMVPSKFIDNNFKTYKRIDISKED